MNRRIISVVLVFALTVLSFGAMPQKKALANISKITALHVKNEVIVELNGKTKTYIKEACSFFEREGYVVEDKELTDSKGKFISTMKLKSEFSTEEMIEKLQGKSFIRNVSPNYITEIEAVEDNSLYKNQWYLENKGQLGSKVNQYDIDYKAKTEKASVEADKEPVIAVIDTGVNVNHPDLHERIWQNPYYISGQLKGMYGYDFANDTDSVSDDNGHGTHCAGIIAAALNKEGIAGVSSNAKILPLRTSKSNSNQIEEYSIVKAIDYVIEAKKLGTNIVAVNMSLGGSFAGDTFGRYLEMLSENKIITCVAAGNDSKDADADENLVYPVEKNKTPYMISVASCESSGRLASYSNYGRSTVDIAAPGTDIVSTINAPYFAPYIFSEEEKEEFVGDWLDESSTALSVEDENKKDITDKVIVDRSFKDRHYFDGDGSSVKLENSKDVVDTDTFTVVAKLKSEASDRDQQITFSRCLYNTSTSLDANVEIYESLLDKDSKVVKRRCIKKSDVLTCSALWRNQQYNVPRHPLGKYSYEYEIRLKFDTASEKCNILLDNFVISKENTDISEMPMYAPMSGTSMACPVITGACAALATVYSSTDEVRKRVLSAVNVTDELKEKVQTRGRFEFSKLNEKRPYVDTAELTANKELTITGINFGDSIDTLLVADKQIDKSAVKEWSDTKIVVNVSDDIYGKKHIVVKKGKLDFDGVFVFQTPYTPMKYEFALSEDEERLYTEDIITADDANIYSLPVGSDDTSTLYKTSLQTGKEEVLTDFSDIDTKGFVSNIRNKFTKKFSAAAGIYCYDGKVYLGLQVEMNRSTEKFIVSVDAITGKSQIEAKLDDELQKKITTISNNGGTISVTGVGNKIYYIGDFVNDEGKTEIWSYSINEKKTEVVAAIDDAMKKPVVATVGDRLYFIDAAAIEKSNKFRYIENGKIYTTNCEMKDVIASFGTGHAAGWNGKIYLLSHKKYDTSHYGLVYDTVKDTYEPLDICTDDPASNVFVVKNIIVNNTLYSLYIKYGRNIFNIGVCFGIDVASYELEKKVVPIPTPTTTPVPKKVPVNINNNTIVDINSIIKLFKTKKPALTSKATKKKQTLKWKKISKATGYEIKISTSKSFKKSKTNTKITRKRTYIIKKKNKTMYVKVRAYMLSGKKKIYSKYSKVVKVAKKK